MCAKHAQIITFTTNQDFYTYSFSLTHRNAQENTLLNTEHIVNDLFLRILDSKLFKEHLLIRG